LIQRHRHVLKPPTTQPQLKSEARVLLFRGDGEAASGGTGMRGGAVFHSRSISAGHSALRIPRSALGERSSFNVLVARARVMVRVRSPRNAWTPAALTGRVLPRLRFTFSSHEALTGANKRPAET
jgi:hypothetical protein